MPRNDVVNIYNVFGLHDVDTTILDGLTERFESEGYTVTEYKDVTEGAGDQGGATLANFVAMAKRASVIVINAHGSDFSGNRQVCTRGKSISRCTSVVDSSPPPTTATTVLPTTTTTTKPKPLPATLQVEWYPTWAAEQAAYKRYITSGYDPSWLFDPYDPVQGNIWARTLIPWRPGDGAATGPDGKPDFSGQGERPWLGITAAGIAHFFKDAKIDLIDNLACHSMALATSFNARSYFGHASTACASFESKDEPTLFDRLIGKSDVPARPTTKAFALGGFVDKYFKLAANAQPIVLSPAVKTVTPKDQARVKRDGNTPASVAFDAVMDQTGADGIVTIEGCDATIKNAKWSNDHTLTFDIAVPKTPTKASATLTIHNDRARAEPGSDPNHNLDGNTQPPSRSGLAQNRDDYTWRVSCGTGTRIQIRTSGTFHSNFDSRDIRGPYHFQVDFRWDAARVYEVTFDAAGAFTYAPVGADTVTATGQTTTTSTDGLDHCQWTAAAKPVAPIRIRGGGAVNKGQGPVRLFQANAWMPIHARPDIALPAPPPTLNQIGTCSESPDGPLPYFHTNPNSAGYDPGQKLGALLAGDIGDVDVDKLAKGPVSVVFPVDYTQTTPGTGFGPWVEHVVAKGTVTVKALG